MKAKLFILMTFITSLVIITCCSTYAEEIANDGQKQILQDVLTEADALACTNNGGLIKNICMAQKPTCVQVYKDAGKQCTSSSECMGMCRADTQIKAGISAKGSCSADNNPCGCFQEIKSGIAQPSLCVD